MELLDLEKKAEQENLEIVNWKFDKKGRIINNIIYINNSLIENERIEKDVLAEELGHYYYSALYSVFDSKSTIEKAEYKAKKWKALALVPPESILRCFKKRNNILYGNCRRT